MVQSTDLEGHVTLARNKIAVLWEARRRQNKMKISFHSSFRNVHPMLSEGIIHQSQKLWVIPAPWSPKQRRCQISCQLCHPTYPCVPLFYLLMGCNSTWKAAVLLLNDIMLMKTVSQINHLYPGCFFYSSNQVCLRALKCSLIRRKTVRSPWKTGLWRFFSLVESLLKMSVFRDYFRITLDRSGASGKQFHWACLLSCKERIWAFYEHDCWRCLVMLPHHEPSNINKPPVHQWIISD